MRLFAVVLVLSFSSVAYAQTGWRQGTPTAAWTERTAHSMVSFQNRLWVLGGYTNNGAMFLNDVWSSSDGGTWTLETAAAGWPPRAYYESTVFNNRIWILGGRGASAVYYNDVWSSADGVNWTLETASAGWTARSYHSVEVFNNRLWVIGGYLANPLPDVWSSADGANWVLETSAAPWIRRAYHSSTVFGGKLWITGGQATVGYSLSEVWSSTNGVNWVLESGSAPWGLRISHATLAFDSQIWLIGGRVDALGVQNDMWSSADGINWTQKTSSGPWPGRMLHSAAVLRGEIVVAGGMVPLPPTSTAHLRDVWAYSEFAAVDVYASTGQATAVLSDSLGPGGAGIEAGKFELSTNPTATVYVTEIEISASGIGDDANAIGEVSLYRDDDSSGDLDYQLDVPVAVASSTFSVDDGAILFSLAQTEQPVPPGTRRSYFVVVKMAGTAAAGDTFRFRVSQVILGGSGAKVFGTPSGEMAGLIVDASFFVFADVSSTTPVTAYVNTSGNVCQKFSISYPAGSPDKPASISVKGEGTADEAADLVVAELWCDANGNGVLNTGVDELVDSQNYTTDNGTVVFSLASHIDFTAGQTRTYFVSYTLTSAAAHLQTFHCYLSSVGAGTRGGIGVGLPCPSVTGTAGLEVSAVVLMATANGPTVPSVVHHDFEGLNGNGALLCNVVLWAAVGGVWTVHSVTFGASGTGNHDTAFSALGLHTDNGNGVWDGPSVDAPAAPGLAGFTGGEATFTLTNPVFAAGSTRRVFLICKLNGTATTGQTFSAGLDRVSATPPPAGVTVGFPTAAAAPLIIDVPAVLVSNGPNRPSAVTHNAGSAAGFVVAQFRLDAVNEPADVSGLVLTGGGTGDWVADVDSATGVRVYADNGDGMFDGADTLLFQGGGAPVVPVAFAPVLSIHPATPLDLWVLVNLTTTAGHGAVAAPETFTLSLANVADVSASSIVVLSSPVPSSTLLGAIEFRVDEFLPLTANRIGGAAITLKGSGFVAPFEVKIGGVVCPGTPTITGGTLAEGLHVPPGTGEGLAIEITSGTLPPQLLPITFAYTAPSSDDREDEDESACSATSLPPLPWFMAVAAVLAVCGSAARRRRDNLFASLRRGG